MVEWGMLAAVLYPFVGMASAVCYAMWDARQKLEDAKPLEATDTELFSYALITAIWPLAWCSLAMGVFQRGLWWVAKQLAVRQAARRQRRGKA